MEVKDIYNTEFFKSINDNSVKAASIVLPYLFEFYKPNSVIDIGCGVGAWLRAAKDMGVETIHGVDINEEDEQNLFVPRDVIDIFDFSNLTSQKEPISHERYDLAISLEVAEHLNRQNAVPFIKYITSFSDVVLFSAALPFQNGTHHVNCQPARYWSDLFKKEGFLCADLFRRRLMFDPQLSVSDWWYGQNSYLFVRDTKKELLDALHEYIVDIPVSYYHQDVVSEMFAQMSKMETRILKMENSLWYRIQRKIKKILHLNIDY